MFKRKTLAQKRAILRKKIRKYEKRKHVSPHRLGKMKILYREMGMQIHIDTPFPGMTLSGYKFVDDDGNELTHREFMAAAVEKVSGPDSPERLLKAEQHSIDSILTGPGHVVDFRIVDNHVQMYIDGIEKGPLFFWDDEPEGYE